MLENGVYCIMPTPFSESGEVDEESLKRLIDFQLEAGVHGLAILGFMGEAYKLTERERNLVISAVIDRVQGKIPIWVGVRTLGTQVTIEQVLEAQRLGADAVFVGAIDVQDDDVLFDFYRSVAYNTNIPLIIHDLPVGFNVTLHPKLIARLNDEVKDIQAIKLEDPPVGPKITRLRELTQDRIKIFGGLGGLYFLEELERGAVGTMTGFAFPEVLVKIFEKSQTGDTAGAAETFDRYMPLIRYEFQPKIGLAFRKYIYQKRGLLASTKIRHPGQSLDSLTINELEKMIRRVGLSLDRAIQEIV